MNVAAGVVGGGLGGVGLACALGASAGGVAVDVAFWIGALLGGALRWRWPGLPVVVVGVALYLLRAPLLQPLLVGGTAVVVVVAVLLWRLLPAPAPGPARALCCRESKAPR